MLRRCSPSTERTLTSRILLPSSLVQILHRMLRSGVKRYWVVCPRRLEVTSEDLSFLSDQTVLFSPRARTIHKLSLSSSLVISTSIMLLMILVVITHICCTNTSLTALSNRLVCISVPLVLIVVIYPSLTRFGYPGFHRPISVLSLLSVLPFSLYILVFWFCTSRRSIYEFAPMYHV